MEENSSNITDAPTSDNSFISTRDMVFAETYASTGDKAAAYLAIKPGVPLEAAQARGASWLRKPEVKAKVLELLQADRRTAPGALVKKFGDLMEANKIISIGRGETIEVPDNGIQLEAAKTVAKAYGVVSDAVDVEISSNVEINVTNADAELLSVIAARLEDMNRSLELNKIQQGEIIEEAQIIEGGEVVQGSEDKN